MIIIPTYNERKNIRSLVERIRVKLPEIPVVFVDDNSPDGTSDEIRSLQSTDPNIQLIQRPGKAGFASAYLDGFKYILSQSNPEFVVTMDADLSHPPEKLPELIAQARLGKVGIGSRYVTGGRVENWKFRRRLLSRLGNFYARNCLGLDLQDATSGFMAIPIEKIRMLDHSRIQNRGYAFLMELKLKLRQFGSQFVEVPIVFEERKEGESKLGSSIVMEGLKYPAKVFFQRQVHENYPAWLLFLISFIVYVFSLPHSMYLGDSPEYITSALSLGIPHPSGNPAYVLIAHLFAKLPFLSPALGVGIFSALTASFGLVIAYLLLERLGNRLTAFAAALVLGFSDMYWSQAVMAKVYAPMFLCLMLIIFLLFKYLEQPKNWYITASLAIFGVGIGIHQGLALFAPIFIIFFLFFIYRLRQQKLLGQYRFGLKPAIIGCLLFLLGLATYAYIPLRSNMKPAYDFSVLFRLDPPGQSWYGFSEYILRTEYQDFAQSFNWGTKQLFLSSFLFDLWQQFSYLLIFAVLGIFYLAFKNRKLFILSSTVLLINILAIILLRSSDWNVENGFLYSFYYLPSYGMVAIWIGAGLAALIKILQPRWQFAISLLFLVLPAVLLSQNYKADYQGKYSFSDTYLSETLTSLPPNAVLLTSVNGAAVDTITFGLQYEKVVNHLRPDVTILNSSNIHPEVDRHVLANIYNLNKPDNARLYLTRYAVDVYPGRPIYTTYLADNIVKGYVSRSNGLVYALTKDTSVITPMLQIDYQKDLPTLASNMFGQDLLAQYFYSQAAACAERKDLHCAQANFIEGIRYDAQVPGIDQMSFISHRDELFQK
ncbi:MAG: glycosyltransferase [Candidatus Doudnabacteria bacterium]|nr:glycosyltransferase [Candidatus Doudnabacteria bacterium]